MWRIDYRGFKGISFVGDLLKFLNICLLLWEKVVWLMKTGGLGIRRIGLFNEALIGKWLWCFGNEITHLWRQVIATKYVEASGGWCTRVVKGTHGCGMWKNIRKDAESFFGHVVYTAREGILAFSSSMTLGAVLFL